MNSNNSNIKKQAADDGTVDDDYTWGRPVTTYLSPHQHIRIVAIKGRLESGRRTERAAHGGTPSAGLIRRCYGVSLRSSGPGTCPPSGDHSWPGWARHSAHSGSRD